MKYEQEEFDGLKIGKSSCIICPELTEKQRPRENDIKGICGNCSTTIFFSKKSSKVQKKLCESCGADAMLFDIVLPVRGRK
jgi:hypothetical protein